MEIKPQLNPNRPLSWSFFSLWEWDKEDWYNKYVLNLPQSGSREMEFGSMIGKKLETDPTFLPQIPRHSKMEKEFAVMLDGIPLVGYADSFCEVTHSKMLEFKTGKKPWDQKRVDTHGQLTMYCLMNYISKKIKPEDMHIELVWMPTQENGDFSISFVDNIEDNIKIFKTKRTMKDILKFAVYIRKTYAQMQKYVQNHE